MLLNLCHRVFNTNYMVTTKIKDLEVQKDIEWRYTTDLVDYETALSTMETRVADIISGKALELIWSLEHPPIYTSGSSSKKEDLLQPDRFPVYNVGYFDSIHKLLKIACCCCSSLLISSTQIDQIRKLHM